VLAEGEELTVDVLSIADGVSYSVQGGKLVLGELEMASNSVLEVMDGDLVLADLPGGGSHAIAGSFRITHSFGSIEILADTEFSGDTFGLVSDFDIADDVNLTVTGSLVLDGCRLLGEDDFSVSVNGGAQLKMVRCDVVGGGFFIASGDVTLVDNLFHESAVTVFAAAAPAPEIYHNVFTGGLGQLTVLPGATAMTESEGWGNVATVSETRNRLILEWKASSLPGRTLDAQGNLFVQPEDAVAVAVQSGDYLTRVQAAEFLLGYQSDYLTTPGLTPLAPWENELYFANRSSSFFGKLDTALGFSFQIESPEGTLTDYTVADFDFEAGSQEGQTLLFFRERDAMEDPVSIETRLTMGGGASAPGYLSTPFTRNSRLLTIDGAAPVVNSSSIEVSQDQGAGPENMLMNNQLTRFGMLDIQFAARDGLAGLVSVGTSVTLDGDVSLTPVFTSESSVTIEGVGFSQFQFQLSIDATTPDGTYDIVATVLDRSGNSLQSLLGTIEIARLNAMVEVQPEDLTPATLVRPVTFVMSDSSGTVLERRTVNVTFTNQVGTVDLLALPLATANLSAKTAWSLRRRLPCLFDSIGDAQVNFTGPSFLGGGDVTGDNVVNLLDYNVIRNNFFQSSQVADINGDSSVNLQDYNILRGNYFGFGDVE
jgi:hypothetical protein